MLASAVGGAVMPPEREVCVELRVPGGDPLAAGGCQPADSGSCREKRPETGRKRSLQTMQSDGQAEVVRDTPDRTSSEDGQQQQQQHRDNSVVVCVDAGLPPMVPVKTPAKASMLPEGVAAAKEGRRAQAAEEGCSEQTTAAKVLEDAVRPLIATKKQQAAETATAKLGKVKSAKKGAARVDRRRKRKTKVASDSAGISQASATMLFRCSCQLLRQQTLDYDVRAREAEERNATQAKEIGEWERKIRSLKRELEEYADEQPDGESTGMALIEAEPAAAVRAADNQKNASSAVTSDTSVAFGATESSLPPTVVAAEAKLLDELHKRTQKVKEFCKSVPGFIDSLDEQIPRHF